MDIKYAILSCDDNPLYKDFWEVIKPIWINKIKIKPILAHITDNNDVIDFGDYIIHNFKAIEGVDTGFQSQIVRMFITKFYPNDVCITSDIDMLPISYDYFNNTTKEFTDDSLVIFSSDAYPPIGETPKKYPLCYNAAQGKTFDRLLDLSSYDFESYVRFLSQRGEGWNTDELYFGECVNKSIDINIIKLKRGWEMGRALNRIDRVNWTYDSNNIYSYIDSHLLRPYSENKVEIHKLIDLI